MSEEIKTQEVIEEAALADAIENVADEAVSALEELGNEVVAAEQGSNADVEANSKKKPNFFVRLGKSIKEAIRKFIVGLKRHPQNIALTVYVAALLVFTLNQTKISDATAAIGRHPMGLCSFVSLLLSILGFVCLLNAFPKRQKVRWVMLGLFFAMMAAVIACDALYYVNIVQGVNDRLSKLEGPAIAEFFTNFSYFFKLEKIMIAHMVLIGVAALLTGLSPLIGKLLRLIKTSIDVEGNGDMDAIERSEDDE